MQTSLVDLVGGDETSGKPIDVKITDSLGAEHDQDETDGCEKRTKKRVTVKKNQDKRHGKEKKKT